MTTQTQGKVICLGSNQFWSATGMWRNSVWDMDIRKELERRGEDASHLYDWTELWSEGYEVDRNIIEDALRGHLEVRIDNENDTVSIVVDAVEALFGSE